MTPTTDTKTADMLLDCLEIYNKMEDAAAAFALIAQEWPEPIASRIRELLFYEITPETAEEKFVEARESLRATRILHGINPRKMAVVRLTDGKENNQ